MRSFLSGPAPCCAELGVELRKVPPATDRTDPSAHKPWARPWLLIMPSWKLEFTKIAALRQVDTLCTLSPPEGRNLQHSTVLLSSGTAHNAAAFVRAV